MDRRGGRGAGVVVGLLTCLALLLALAAPAPSEVAPAAVAALAVALSGLLAGRRALLPVTLRGAVTPRSAYDAWATLRGRVHDPVHHPRRPRAPGLG